MYKKFLLLFLSLTMISMTACGQDETAETNSSSQNSSSSNSLSAAHKIDKDLDVILGKEEAPHELIAYYSPGCIHCLTLFEKTFRAIKQHYIDTGKLRYIIRDVPTIVPFKRDANGGTTKFMEAQKNSVIMATTARCTYHYTTVPEGYTKTLDTAIQGVVKGMQLSKGDEWPYLSEDGIRTTFNYLGGQGMLTPAQYKTCLENGPLKEKFYEAFDRNGNILTKELEVKSLPAYFLDGEHISFENVVDQAPLVMSTLKEKVE